MPSPPWAVWLPKPSVEKSPLEGVSVQVPPLPPPEEEEEEEGEEVEEGAGMSVEDARLFKSAREPEVRAASSKRDLVKYILTV